MNDLPERWVDVCHKRHGWIFAPDHGYWTLSESGKSVELHTPEVAPNAPLTWYPFGTRFNLTSITAYGEDWYERQELRAEAKAS